MLERLWLDNTSFCSFLMKKFFTLSLPNTLSWNKYIMWDSYQQYNRYKTAYPREMSLILIPNASIWSIWVLNNQDLRVRSRKSVQRKITDGFRKTSDQICSRFVSAEVKWIIRIRRRRGRGLGAISWQSAASVCTISRLSIAGDLCEKIHLISFPHHCLSRCLVSTPAVPVHVLHLLTL